MLGEVVLVGGLGGSDGDEAFVWVKETCGGRESDRCGSGKRSRCSSIIEGNRFTCRDKVNTKAISLLPEAFDVFHEGRVIDLPIC